MPLTSFKGIANVGDSLLSDNLEGNLIAFFNWGLLNIGAFSNAYNSQLRLVTDPRAIAGTIWEPSRNDIVWETGVAYTKQSPISISGVSVNNQYYPSTGTGPYAHHVDYNRGLIVFDRPIPVNSVVKINYSYRYFHLATADVPWFREIMYNSLVVDGQFDQAGSGIWNILSQNRVQLPLIIVEAAPNRSFAGYQLGGGQFVYTDVLFHIFTENSWDRKTALDVVSYQNNNTIYGFDKNAIANARAFPLDNRGALASGAKTYPQLIAPTGVGGYFWKNIIFKNMRTENTPPAVPPLYRACVRGTFELIFGEL